MSRGEEICVTLLPVSSGIFNSWSFYSSSLPLSRAASSRAFCEGAVPVLLSPMGGPPFPGSLLSRFRRSGCIYRCSSFPSVPRHKLTLTGSTTPRPPKDQHHSLVFSPEKAFSLASQQTVLLCWMEAKWSSLWSCSGPAQGRGSQQPSPALLQVTCPGDHPASLGRDSTEEQTSHCSSS